MGTNLQQDYYTNYYTTGCSCARTDVGPAPSALLAGMMCGSPLAFGAQLALALTTAAKRVQPQKGLRAGLHAAALSGGPALPETCHGGPSSRRRRAAVRQG